MKSNIKFMLVKCLCAISGHKWHIEGCRYNKLSDGEYVFYSARCLRCSLEKEAQMPFFEQSGEVSYAISLKKN